MTLLKRLIPVITAWVLFAGPGGTAWAGQRDFVVHISRLGGDAESAKPYVAKFSALIEKRMGWPTGSCRGAFYADRKQAILAIKKLAPGFALLDPPLYFELRAAENLTLVSQLESKELVSARLHIVVKDPAMSSLEKLKGKRLWTPLADTPTYLSRVVLDGKVDATSHFALKRVGNALKGVRAVLRGEADATLVDDDQLAAAKKMQGGAALRTVFDSPPLPPLPVVVFSKTMPAAAQKSLASMLPKVCAGDGATICKEMRLPPFKPVNAGIFKQVQARFDRP